MKRITKRLAIILMGMVGLLILFLAVSSSSSFSSTFAPSSSRTAFGSFHSPPKHHHHGNGLRLQPSNACTSATACPMGLSDYGFNGANQYTYTTTLVESVTTFDRLYIGTSTGTAGMTLQLNAVTNGVVENSNTGTYWTQDVAVITQNNGGCNIFGCFPTTYTIQFVDNIWNFTTGTAGMNGPITGNLLGRCSGGIGSSSGTNFYFCVGPTFTTTLPFTIVLTMIVDVNPTNGDSRVGFFYEVASPTVFSFGGYDSVDFSSNFAGSPAYTIGGTAPNGISSDLENVIGGNAGGALVTMNTINAFMNLEFGSASGLILVPHAWSAGGETGEDVSNVYMQQPSPSTGQAITGADDFIQLW